jgi:hypothetical protein
VKWTVAWTIATFSFLIWCGDSLLVELYLYCDLWTHEIK